MGQFLPGQTSDVPLTIFFSSTFFLVFVFTILKKSRTLGKTLEIKIRFVDQARSRETTVQAVIPKLEPFPKLGPLPRTDRN